MPGTLRDSLFILDAIHARDGEPKPETVITDTASYSDVVFGLFAICGYQFSPRIADISDARLRRTNTAADYGPLQTVSNHTIRLDRIRAHWGDMLRVAGSLTLGEVRGHDLIRMLSRAPAPIRLRRGIPAHDRRPAQRHRSPPPPRPPDLLRAARRTAPALPRRDGASARRPRPGPERCGAVQYIEAAVKRLAADGFPETDELLARLSPLQYDHINFLGRYAFTRPAAPGLRHSSSPSSGSSLLYGSRGAGPLRPGARTVVRRSRPHITRRAAVSNGCPVLVQTYDATWRATRTEPDPREGRKADEEQAGLCGAQRHRAGHRRGTDRMADHRADLRQRHHHPPAPPLRTAGTTRSAPASIGRERMPISHA
ncbi:Tn3 family transposase [Streptomyces sp. NA02950]|nr:Tn3 family transposase [Streptomyces sp. NA02950]